MRQIHIALLAVALPLLAQTSVAQGRLSPAQMEEDLFAVADAFDLEHAGLRRYTAAEDYDAAFFEAMAFCSEPRTPVEFYRSLSALVSLVRCGHTRVQMMPAQIAAAVGEAGLLPIEVHLLGERAFVLSTIGEGVALEPGQEILAIDGITIPEIRTTAFRHQSADGFIETGKQRELEGQLPLIFSLLVSPRIAGVETFEVTLAGQETPVVVAGISHSDYLARPRREARPPLMSLTRETEGVERLFIRGFGDEGGDSLPFPEQLEAHFVDLRKRQVPDLIVDLRGNGGGRDMYGALLVSYFSPSPFRYFERIEVTEGYEGGGGIIEQDGMRLVTEHSGTQLQQPAEHRFEGRAFLLTDGRTFSTAADVATVAHFNGLATLVGEETGGGYDGNTSGQSERRNLSGSGFVFSIPKWMYTTANLGHDRHGRGAPVEQHVRPTIEDVLAGRDAEVEWILQQVGQ